MVDTAGVLGMAGSIRSGGRRAAIATTALALAISVGAVGAVASSAATLVAAAAPTKCHGVEATIVGTAGDDKIIGTNKADVIVAGAGDDVVKGRGGDDVICDRDGDDVVRGGKGDDVLRGAAGADLVVGGAGTDLLRGGKGKDDLRGGTGDDKLNGGKAVDDCDGGPGVNTLVNCENVANTAPVAANDAAGTTEDTQKLLDVLANDTDPDGDSLLVTSVDATGMKGTVTITGGGSGVSYDPHGQFEALGAGIPGADSFSYTISDGKGGTDTASVAVTINGTDDPPHAVADTKTVAEDSSATTIDVRGNDTDIDGGPKTITQVTQPASGTVAITNDGADLTYEPDADYCNDGSPDRQLQLHPERRLHRHRQRHRHLRERRRGRGRRLGHRAGGRPCHRDRRAGQRHRRRGRRHHHRLGDPARPRHGGRHHRCRQQPDLRA